MATLASGLMTIEANAILWRDVINYSNTQLGSKSVIDALYSGYSLTTHDHAAVYKTRVTAATEIAVIVAAGLSYDVDFEVDSKGIILTDRTLSTYKRLYMSDGVLLVENA